MARAAQKFKNEPVVTEKGPLCHKNDFRLSFFFGLPPLVDLFFIEYILHLPHVKKMYSQTIHLSHESITLIQIVK